MLAKHTFPCAAMVEFTQRSVPQTLILPLCFLEKELTRRKKRKKNYQQSVDTHPEPATTCNSLRNTQFFRDAQSHTEAATGID